MLESAPLITRSALLVRTVLRDPVRIIGGDTKVNVRVSILNATETLDVELDAPVPDFGVAAGTLILMVPDFALEVGLLEPFDAGAASVKLKGPLALLKILSGNFAVAIPLVTPEGRLLEPPLDGGVTVTVIGTTPVAVPTKGGGGGADVVEDDAGDTAEDALDAAPVPAALVAVTVNV
jgi:hypothetical protein